MSNVPPPSTLTPPIRVAIGDDDPQIRKVLQDFIEFEPGLELAGVATDGPETIDLVRNTSPDVILLDVRMPGGGIVAASQINQISSHTKIIAFSAHHDRNAVTEMFRLGAYAFLLKGSTLEEILSAIKKAHQGIPTLSEDLAPTVVHELRRQLGRNYNAHQEQVSRVSRVSHVLNGHGLNVEYQPVVAVSTGAVVGYEALSRFTALPYRTPDLWFAEAYSVGLGVEMEFAPLGAALDSTPLLPPPCFLSFNLSPVAIISPEFDELLKNRDLTKLVIEITEHARIDDYDTLLAALRPYRAEGLRLAIDDAGAGFASLRHILLLAPDLIKLDISLIRDIDLDASRRALARGLITFGDEIGALLIGEGVETATELETLTELGVSFAQGYFLGHPGPLPTPPFPK